MWGRSKDKRVPSSAAQSASMKAVLQIQSFLLTVASISSYLPQTEALLRQKKKKKRQIAQYEQHKFKCRCIMNRSTHPPAVPAVFPLPLSFHPSFMLTM